MPKPSLRQRKTEGRVMHEFKHGELKRGRGGKGGKVKARRQAIAIALHEAGASKYESKKENRRSFARTRRKETRGETAQQEKEGSSRVGARGRRGSSRAMGGKSVTRAELYERAKRRHIPGRSKMSKRQLQNALR
jgi:hypothetical protein